MILGIDRLVARLKEQYDKVIAFVVLLLLVFSLVSLGVKVGFIRQMQAEFDGWIKTRHPLHPTADSISPDGYNSTMKLLDEPFVLHCETFTNGSMFVPQTRFSCMACRLPVNINAEKCPFCGAKPIKDVKQDPDPDKDGLPTEWEDKYGLDPFDAADAGKDNDGDGYTNLEEYQQGPFDPLDPQSHPASVKRLELKSITGERFALLFKSRINTGHGYKFVLNYRLPDGRIKTEFVKVGDKVAGVTVSNYREHKVRVRDNFPKEDRSELTLTTKGGDDIVLQIGKPTKRVKLTAHLMLPHADGKNETFDVTKNDKFEIEGAVYKVITIDGDKGTVIIQDEINKKRTEIKGAVKLDQPVG